MSDIDRSEIYHYKFKPDWECDGRTFVNRWIEKNSFVLDVGCACGDLGAYLHREKNCRVVGLEYDPKSIVIAQRFNAYEEIFQVDLNTFSPETLRQYRNQFDYIVFADVLEHLYAPQTVLSQFLDFLKPGGYFLLSVPNIAHASIKANLLRNDFTYTDIGLLDRTHIRFFTCNSIPSFLADLGLEIVDATGTVISRQGFQPNDPFFQLPLSCRRLILKDIHSWVSQYVMKIQPSSMDLQTLLSHNREKLQFNKDSVSKYIYHFNCRSQYYLNVYVYPYLVRKKYGQAETDCHKE